jgi:hypothetical protein
VNVEVNVEMIESSRWPLAGFEMNEKSAGYRDNQLGVVQSNVYTTGVAESRNEPRSSNGIRTIHCILQIALPFSSRHLHRAPEAREW